MQQRTAGRPTQPIRVRSLRGARPGRELERFELLVDELSAVMTRTPADGVDGEIESWLMSVIRLLILCTLRIRGSGLIILHFPGISTPRNI